MSDKSTSKDHLGVLFHPANLLKTVASQVPIASALVEVQNQLAGHEYGKRIDSLEAGMLLAAKVQALEAFNPSPPAPLHDWSIPAAEFARRTVDVAVAYDKGFHTGANHGKELIQPLAHACIIGDREILICKEALELALAVAAHKHGRIVILAGMAWYGIEPGPHEEAVGLSVLRLTDRDEMRWAKLKQKWLEHGMEEPQEADFASPLRFSTGVWMGQEIGFVHSGEATDVMSGTESYTDRQFDTCVISHFREPTTDGLKLAVTGVLPGRVMCSGSPVFSRDGTLLGLLSDTESYKSDAGRRAVVRSLLGHPRFTKFLKPKENTDE